MVGHTNGKLHLSPSMLLKIGTLVVAIAGLFWRVNALESNISDLKKTADARDTEYRVIMRQHDMMMAEQQHQRKEIDKLQEKMDRLLERRR